MHARGDGYGRRDRLEDIVARAEIDVIVGDARSPVIDESILDAAADRPSDRRGALLAEHVAGRGVEFDMRAAPGEPTGHVGQEAAPDVSDARSYGCEIVEM